MPDFTLGVLIPPHVTDINAFVDGQLDRYDFGYPEANCKGNRLIRCNDADVIGTGPWLAGVRNTGHDGLDVYDLDPNVIDHAIPTTQRALDCDIIPHALITATGCWWNHDFDWGPGEAHEDYPHWKRRVRRILRRHPGHRMIMLVTRSGGPAMNKHDLETLTEDAIDAFWDVVVQRFPDTRTGDLSFGAQMELKATAQDAIREWIMNNVSVIAHLDLDAHRELLDDDGEENR